MISDLYNAYSGQFVMIKWKSNWLLCINVIWKCFLKHESNSIISSPPNLPFPVNLRARKGSLPVINTVNHSDHGLRYMTILVPGPPTRLISLSLLSVTTGHPVIDVTARFLLLVVDSYEVGNLVKVNTRGRAFAFACNIPKYTIPKLACLAYCLLYQGELCSNLSVHNIHRNYIAFRWEKNDLLTLDKLWRKIKIYGLIHQ